MPEATETAAGGAAAELDELLRVAVEAARAGGEIALRWHGQPELLQIREKADDADLVSQADLEAEAAMRHVLTSRRGDDAVIGEEAGISPGASGVVWAIDPIDGTTNFLYGRPSWAVSVAALRAEDSAVLAGAIYQPIPGEVASARVGGGANVNGATVRCRSTPSLRRSLIEVNLGHGSQRGRAGVVVDRVARRVRDVRACGSAACALAAVAAGRLDAYWGPGLRVWDAAAGLLLVNEAGGQVGDLTGSSGGRWPVSGNLLAGRAEICEELRELLTGVYRPGDCGPPPVFIG